MRPITIAACRRSWGSAKPAITLCALAAAAIAAPASAAVNAYLEIGPIKGESAAKSAPAKQIEITSWSWGATEAGRVNLNSSKSNVEGGAADAAKFGAVGGMHRDESVASPRDTASMPTEKRQHGWVTFSKRNAAGGVDGPLDRGSLRVKVKFPWLDCRVGAALPDAALQNDAGRYEFKEVMITSCAPDSVSLDYAKVKVRGWDPAKKE